MKNNAKYDLFMANINSASFIKQKLVSARAILVQKAITEAVSLGKNSAVISIRLHDYELEALGDSGYNVSDASTYTEIFF